MNKTTKRLLFAVLILLLFLLTVYFVLAFYYREGFSLNTWINGVYCTGKTVEEVNSELLSHTEAPNVVIVDKAGEEYTIALADVDYRADFGSALEAYRQEQNPYLWVDNVLLHSRQTLAPAVTVDEEALRRAYNALEFVQTEQGRITDYSLTRDTGGLCLHRRTERPHRSGEGFFGIKRNRGEWAGNTESAGERMLL